MSALTQLAACGGTWAGTNTLHNPMTQQPENSTAVAHVQPILGGRYVRLDYRWRLNETPHEGFMLIGISGNTHVLHWVDSWHMAEPVMVCAGEISNETNINVVGHYAAGDGPDWGWRTIIKPNPGSALRIEMHNISPEGEEEIAVEIDLMTADAAPR